MRSRVLFFSIFYLLAGCQLKPTLDSAPNIVWLVSEDNSKHFLQLYDSTGVEMSSLSRLLPQGLLFNHAFSNAPVCSVARSTIITGCYAPRIGAQYHRCIQKVPMPGELRMFPHYLREAGYYTSNNAKEDYNLVKGDGVWDESSKTASYRNRPADRPFFHVQNFGITHEGQLHFPAKDLMEQPTQTDPASIKPFPYHQNTVISKYTYARLHDNHIKLDEQLNAFIDQLEQDGLMDDTFIFYYGDHGGVLPRSKGYVYESGLHVPLLVYVPKNYRHLVSAAPGSSVDGFVSFVDLAPTVLALAGVDIPQEMDGEPFLGNQVSQTSLNARNTVFGYADRFDEKYDLVRTLRRGNLKYMRSYQPFNVDGLHNFYRYRMLMFDEWRSLYRDGKLSKVQMDFFGRRAPEGLYDLSVDPHELNNLKDDPGYATQLQEMRDLLRQKVTSLPDLSFYPEPYLLEVGLEDPAGFGQRQKNEISALVEVADLELEPFDQVKSHIDRLLKDVNPWKRYWALIVCSSFGEEANEFIGRARKMADGDEQPLVRMRALEFLTLSEVTMPPTLFEEILSEAESMAEANLMLNSIALLKEVAPSFTVPNVRESVPAELVTEDKSLVPHRLDYLTK